METPKNHDFSVKLNEIGQISKEINEKKIDIDHVEIDGGLFGWGNHKVTGSEFNRRIGDIVRLFVDHKNTNLKVFDELRQIYKTFNALDVEYVQGLKSSIGAIKKVNDELINANKKITENQYDIKRAVEGLSLTVKKLSETKQELYEELRKLDSKVREYTNRIQDEMVKFDQTRFCINKEIIESEKKRNLVDQKIQNLEQYLTEFKKEERKMEENSQLLTQSQKDFDNKFSSTQTQLLALQTQFNRKLWIIGVTMGTAIVGMALKLFGII